MQGIVDSTAPGSTPEPQATTTPGGMSRAEPASSTRPPIFSCSRARPSVVPTSPMWKP
jgi:hypothetical protein